MGFSLPLLRGLRLRKFIFRNPPPRGLSPRRNPRSRRVDAIRLFKSLTSSPPHPRRPPSSPPTCPAAHGPALEYLCRSARDAVLGARRGGASPDGSLDLAELRRSASQKTASLAQRQLLPLYNICFRGTGHSASSSSQNSPPLYGATLHLVVGTCGFRQRLPRILAGLPVVGTGSNSSACRETLAAA